MIARLKCLDEYLKIDEVLDCLSKENVETMVLLKKSKDVIFALFDDILKFNPDIDLLSFLDVFSHVASIVKINNLPLSLDSVKIVDANNSMEIFDQFYLVGVNHENAPVLKHDCGIILDTEIEKLNFKHKLSPTISHINKLSKLRLFNSVLMFEKECVLT